MFLSFLTSAITLFGLEVEQLTDPLAVDTPTPRLSWVIDGGSKKNVIQTSYQVLVASSPDKLNEKDADVWNSGIVESSQSTWVPYAGPALKPMQRVFWKVRVNTTAGRTPWSETSSWGMGKMTENRWVGQWIGWEAPFEWDKEETHSRLSVRYLRKEFSLDKKVSRATVYLCGLGLYDLFINGRHVGDDVLAPAPSAYNHTVLYNVYDVTDYLSSDNAIGVALGPGRYYPMQQNYKPYKIPHYGYPKLRLDLHIEYADGTSAVISSNESWKLTADGPIRSANEYDGEEYDARKDLGAWTKSGYDESGWLQARRSAIPDGTLRAAISPNIKVKKTMPVRKIISRRDSYILDFGQNMSGWVRMRLSNTTPGQKVTLTFAETLAPDGGLYRANLRHADSRDTYICNGMEAGTWWNPEFTTHGFRYVEVEGLPGAGKEDFEAQLVYDDFESTGTFESSNVILDTVWHNAWWGIASNYKGMPIDCPQRDERQPWLGDRVAGALGENFLFDAGRLYAKWTRDICESQREDGCIPDVAPNFWNYYSDDMTWPAALPFSCDMLWEQYGDLEPIVRCYPNIVKWMKHMADEYRDEDGIITKDKYGDWCMPPESLELVHAQDPARITDGALIATAYYVKICRMLSKFARLQGFDADATFYDLEAERTTAAFNKRFLVNKKGTAPKDQSHFFYPDSVFYGNNTVTANVLPVAFDMVPEDCREEVCNNIVKKIIVDGGGHISCGVIGLQWIQHELDRMGRSDISYLLATQKSYPSYGYMAMQGATTIWELWNGNTANPSMNSGNHVMLLGDLISWYYHDLAGIRPAEPGYKTIELRPQFDIDDLSYVNASYKTLYGKVTSNWKKTLNKLEWDIQIPANTSALVWFPGESAPERLGSGTYHFSRPVHHPEHVLEESFLYEKASFPQCHASTIAETPSGDLVSAFFGGTAEKNPDVCIWVCRKEKGSDTWSQPQLVADGIQSPTLRYPCWNPVLFQIPGGDLMLFYKVGPTIPEWVGYIRRSKDGGRTWSEPQRLPDGILGAIKNKPVMIGNRIICPSSTEKDHWRIHFEISDDGGYTWRKVGPVAAPEEFQLIQPSILVHKDGSLQALCRTKNNYVGCTWSRDNGETWSEVELLDVYQNQSGLDAVTLADGTFALVYNNAPQRPTEPKGPRTPLNLALSKDGIHWEDVLVIEDSPISQYSYPSVIQGADGSLHIVYTWRRTRIKYVRYK